MSISIATLHEKILPLVGTSFPCPITKNKGATGLLLEKITGLPHGPHCLDCSDGELKTIPLKQLKDGSYVPKETMAVTMVNEKELETCCFQDSRCGKKMERVLIVPYMRAGEMITYLTPTLLEKSKHASIYEKIEEDYSLIRENYKETKELKSSLGKYLQTRTKGAGHGSTSRAFYLRTGFLKDFVTISELAGLHQ